ncbi:hypothetical protein OH77DRAFT_1068610 [Trametes cingulata]|nr:hypothetical protein OH77DRAFT_1068610 [Trametes cingulata]
MYPELVKPNAENMNRPVDRRPERLRAHRHDPLPRIRLTCAPGVAAGVPRQAPVRKEGSRDEAETPRQGLSHGELTPSSLFGMSMKTMGLRSGWGMACAAPSPDGGARERVLGDVQAQLARGPRDGGMSGRKCARGEGVHQAVRLRPDGLRGRLETPGCALRAQPECLGGLPCLALSKQPNLLCVLSERRSFSRVSGLPATASPSLGSPGEWDPGRMAACVVLASFRTRDRVGQSSLQSSSVVV